MGRQGPSKGGKKAKKSSADDSTSSPAASAPEPSQTAPGPSNTAPGPSNIVPMVRTGRSLAQFQHERMQALVNRISAARGVLYGQAGLRAFLERTGWEVADAFALWQAAAQRRAATTGGSNMPPPVPQSTIDAPTRDPELPVHASNGVPIVRYENVEETRRETARLLRDMLHATQAPAHRQNYPVAELILVLLLEGWDVEAAYTALQDRNTVGWRLHDAFDRMRRPTADVGEMDERVALMVRVTGRGDFFSLRQHLVAHNYNVVTAVGSWYHTGIRPQRHRLDIAGLRTEGQDRRLGRMGQIEPMPTEEQTRPAAVGFDVWGPVTQTFKPDAERGPNQKAAEKITSKKPKGTRPQGYLITEDLERPAHRGCPDPTKMSVEFFNGKGKYWHNAFIEKEYQWPEKGEMADRSMPLFDWDNPKHVSHLVRWREQQLARVLGDLIREEGQDFTQAEMDKLEEIFDKHYKATGAKGKIRFSEQAKETMEEEFNKEFEGKTPPGVNGPRRPRKASALLTKARRTKSFCTKYGLNFDDQKGNREEERRKQAAEKKRKRSAEEDDDDSNDNEDEDDDEEEEDDDDDNNDENGDDDDMEEQAPPKKRLKASERKK